MVLAIGPSRRFFPEMITMDTCRVGSTPHGVYSITERIKRPAAEVPDAGTGLPAARTIGNRKGFTVGCTRARTRSEDRRPPRGHRLMSRRRGRGDWDFAPQFAARSQHNGIDWDCARDRGEAAP